MSDKEKKGLKEETLDEVSGGKAVFKHNGDAHAVTFLDDKTGAWLGTEVFDDGGNKAKNKLSQSEWENRMREKDQAYNSQHRHKAY